MNVTEAIEMANKVEQPEPTQVGLDGNRQIKALIISLTADAAATAGLTKYTGPGAPILRSQLRLVVEAVVSPG